MMQTRFETNDLLSPSDQFACWREVIFETWFGMWAERTGLDPFHVTIDSQRVGEIHITQAHLPKHQMGRSASEIARFSHTAYCLQHLHEGTVHGSYRGAEYEAGPGDLLLFDTAEPCDRFVIAQPVRATVLHIPRNLIDRQRTSWNQPPIRVHSRDGMGALLSGYIGSLSETATSLQSEIVGKVSSILCDLVMAAFQPAAPIDSIQSGIRQARLAKAHQYIAANLTNPELGVGKVAAHLKVSPRYVQKLFKDTGQTFSETLVSARLEACYRTLADARQSRRTIADIAFGYGFNDLSWFYRSYKQQWGETPGETRTRMIRIF